MAEITLRDLLRWDRRLQLIPPRGIDRDTALDHGVSWVVSVRAAPPLLPPLRGDELVVLPRRVLEQIETAQMLRFEDLLATLSREKIAALLTEPELAEEPLGDLPVLTMPAPFPHDAEGTLNRLLTERRAELYRLGNELSRRLSQAAMDPRGVDGLLDVAADVAGRPMVLQDADGVVVARGGAEPLDPAGPEALERVRGSGGAIVLTASGVERLITAVVTQSGFVYLSIVAPEGTLNEADRLVLTQTAGTAAVVLSQGNALGARGLRQQGVVELLTGRLTSEASVAARARGLGIDPSAPVVTGVITAGEHAASRIADQFVGGITGAERAEIDGEMVLIVPASGLETLYQRLDRFARQDNPPARLAISEPVSWIMLAPTALRQARFAAGLQRAGVLPGSVVRCDRLDDMGVFGLLYHLWGNPAVDVFCHDVLGELEAYDERRGTGLIETLEVYLSSGGSVSEAARQLNVHRNTLAYRIGRIGELSGRDLSQPEDRLLLRVALLCRHLLPNT